MTDAQPASPPQHRLLIIEDTDEVIQSIASAMGSVVLAEGVSVRPGLTIGQLRDRLLALRASAGPSWALRTHDGDEIDALGVNAHLCLHGASSRTQRSPGFGLQVVKWLRVDWRLTTPILVWSFLSLDSLKTHLPSAFLCETGLVFLRLPASADEFREAFGRALAQDNALTPEDLGRALCPIHEGNAQPATSDLRDSSPRSAMARISQAYGFVDSSLEAAFSALEAGRPEELAELLAGAAWRSFLRSVRAVERNFVRGAKPSRQITDISRHAMRLASFPTWLRQCTDGEPLSGNEAAFYRESLLILRNTLRGEAGNHRDDPHPGGEADG